MGTTDRDKSTMMALHELRAIEARRIAAEAEEERARREAEARQAEARRAREQAEREARERDEQEEHERIERERDELQAKAERVAHLEGEVEALSRRMAELREGFGPAGDPLLVSATAPTARHWAWGFAAVSWLGAFTLIAILWHVAQRPPVLPHLVPPIIDLTPRGAPPLAGQAGTTTTTGPAAPGGRAGGGPTEPVKAPSAPGSAGTRHGLHHPPSSPVRDRPPGVTSKASLEDCSRSEDPLACVHLGDETLQPASRSQRKGR
jgi:hypothetical protein